MKHQLAILAAGLALAAAAPAGATIVLGTGAGVLQPDENLLFTNDPADGAVIQGITNQTDTLVSIFGGETLHASGGQARVESVDAFLSSPFTFRGFTGEVLGFDLANQNLAFTQTEFKIFVGRGTATQATLIFVDTDGQVFTDTFAIPASGFFNAQAIDGQAIDFFAIATNGTIKDVRQIRIGGVAAMVPEPASWALMILGFGCAGGMLRRRRTALA